MSPNCLLEIGVEELPAGYIPPALDQLQREVSEAIKAQGLSHGLCLPLGTPRRLALFVGNLPERQEDRVERVSGPPESAAYDAKGLPTRAAQGFAERHGVDVANLRVEETERGRYITVEKTIPGRAVGEILTEIFGQVIGRLAFPKTMIWGAEGLRFARPVRWLVALLDREVLPLEIGGLKAGRTTRGHRFLNTRGDLDLERAELDHYRDVLSKRCVLVDPHERRAAVAQQVAGVLGESDARRVVIDEGLIDTVANLVEWPMAMVGKFDEDFLEVPREVLQTAMIHHQRYFPVENGGGGLTNAFVFVSNGSAEHAEQITAGNERVLRARLADAQFFYREDRKRTLEQHAEDLGAVTWHERLGSYAAKVGRLVALARAVGEELKISGALAARVEQAARICKADLVTGMVGEFPELQGTMGRIYHLAEEGDPETARAIEEHWWPRAAGGVLPETQTGALLSVLDKIDSIVGCFRVGLAPTGSQDPYALRRQALGIVRILRGRGEWSLPLVHLVAAASAGYGDEGEACDIETVDFIKARLRNLLVEEGARAEVVDAIFVTADDEVASLVAKAGALTEIVDQPDFAEIAVAAKRVLNILRQA
ncbi:glycine--tRNA ligase subunit beta, partial [Candidatus Sumerlaeota bacterium]|nr:glycine--tRNA ligase subunit beta [Candidatus Sumerlaeota bacterium]